MLIGMRNAMMAGKSLPYDAEVENLQVPYGMAWIDTGYVPKSLPVLKLEGDINYAGNFYMGTELAQNGFGYRIRNQNSSYGEIYLYTGSSWVRNQTSPSLYADHIIVQSDGQKISCNGKPAIAIDFDFSQNSQSWLILRACGSNSSSVTKLRYCKIWEGSTLVRDLIPVRRTLDGVSVGEMYDRVTGTFMERHGTFVIGADVASGVSAANGGGYKLRCPRRSYRRSSRPSAQFFQPRLWKEVA